MFAMSAAGRALMLRVFLSDLGLDVVAWIYLRACIELARREQPSWIARHGRLWPRFEASSLGWLVVITCCIFSAQLRGGVFAEFARRLRPGGRSCW